MGETSLLMPEEGTLAGQFEDLRRRATKDALSGLLNRATSEELYTVNTEHRLRLDELTTMTDGLSSFPSSTMIGTLFVDSNLNIHKRTEYVGREFQLMEHDVGRSIQIFAHSFPDEAIEADCKTVLRDLISINRGDTAMNGRFYTLRIAPYRTTERNIRGLVITIIDSLGSRQSSRVLSIEGTGVRGMGTNPDPAGVRTLRKGG